MGPSTWMRPTKKGRKGVLREEKASGASLIWRRELDLVPVRCICYSPSAGHTPLLIKPRYVSVSTVTLVGGGEEEK